MEENVGHHISLNLCYLFHSKVDLFICINMGNVWRLTQYLIIYKPFIFLRFVIHHDSLYYPMGLEISALELEDDRFGL